MGVYCTVSDLEAAGISPVGIDAQELLRRAERDVDNFAAPAAPILSNGHKFGPTTLADYQVAALRYAVLAQASYRVEMSESAMGGSDEYLPGEVQPYRRGGPVSRQAMAELAGTGLIVWSGTVEVTT